LGVEPDTFTSVTALTTLLGVNADKTKHMLVSRHQNAGQNHYINITNIFFANKTELKDLEMAVTNEITFTDKLGTDYIWGILGTNQFRILVSLSGI
jgi:hypothetical protein